MDDTQLTKWFFEIHRDLPREGPGNSPSTRKAFSMLKDLPQRPRILDIGCGPGMQTLDLAQLSAGTIVAVDNHQPYLDALESTIRQHGFSGRVHIMNQDMSELDFEKGSFDVIWSEGAIYIMGFENGIRAWKRFLKHGGYMAVTELSWLRPDAPKEAEQFWARAYPAMKTLHGNLEIIRETGLQVVGHFVLPDSAWWETYYLPLEQNLARFRRKYDGDENAIRLADTEQMEIDLFRRYSDYYGYVFYLMQDR